MYMSLCIRWPALVLSFFSSFHHTFHHFPFFLPPPLLLLLKKNKCVPSQKAVDTRSGKSMLRRPCCDVTDDLWWPASKEKRASGKGGNRLRHVFSRWAICSRNCVYVDSFRTHTHARPVISFGRGLAFSPHTQRRKMDVYLWVCKSIWKI